jgi:signal transduction histidine kinase
MFRSRLFWNLFAAYALWTLVTAGAFVTVLSERQRESVRNHVRDRLRDAAIVLRVQAAEAFDADPSEGLQEWLRQTSAETGIRVTLIAADGTVLADSSENPKEMDDHSGRPEILTARQGGIGVAERPSPTLTGAAMMYVAVPVGEASEPVGFVRAAMDMAVVNEYVADIQRWMFWTVAIFVATALLLTYFIVSRITRPIATLTRAAESMAAGDLEQRISVRRRDELGTLAGAFNAMSGQITARLAELGRLENLRREFVSNVSHELKTPLTSIQAYTETLLDGAIDDAEHNRQFLMRIAEQADRLHALILDLLRLARIESGGTAFELTTVRLDDVLPACRDSHAAVASSRGVTLTIRRPGSPVRVCADADGLRTIFDNLIDNAIKYTPAGGSVTVAWRIEGEYAAIEIADTGIGIPEEHVSRIFERFYRVDKARSRELGGTGLGLSIVKHLVQVFAGTVHVESHPGRGSTFTVQLPLAEHVEHKGSATVCQPV